MSSCKGVVNSLTDYVLRRLEYERGKDISTFEDMDDEVISDMINEAFRKAMRFHFNEVIELTAEEILRKLK